jgi:hypothetical protein
VVVVLRHLEVLAMELPAWLVVVETDHKAHPMRHRMVAPVLVVHHLQAIFQVEEVVGVLLHLEELLALVV